ncbi:MAG: DUF1592 domain-containing protein [Opitutales bacterium]
MKTLFPIAIATFVTLGLSAEVSFERAHSLIRTYCTECHNPADEKGGLDLAVFESKADFLAQPILLEDLEWVVAEHEMPTPEAPKQPTAEEREVLLTWLQETLHEIQNARPNDPGPVVVPRISSKEFDYVIEDLTGRDYELAQYLTSDTAGGEGFFNVGAGQQLSVGQFESFMSVGKMLMSYARYVPGKGIWWLVEPDAAPQSDADLAAYLQKRWVDWHNETLKNVHFRHLQAIEGVFREPGAGLGAYLEAAWRYQHREALGKPEATLADFARRYEVPLFEGGLEKVWRLFGTDDESRDEYVHLRKENAISRELIEKWRALPAPASGDPNHVREELNAMLAWNAEQKDHHEWHWFWTESEFEAEPADEPERQQWRGFYHRGRGITKVDLTKVPGEHLYLAATGELYPGETDPLVVWREGTVEMADGSTKPWNKVFTEMTLRDGSPVSFGYHPEDWELPEGEIAHYTPGYLKLRIPEGAKMLTVFGEYDARQDGSRILRVRPFAEEPPNYLEAFKTRKVLGKDHADEEIRESVADIYRAGQLQRGAHWVINFEPEDVFIGAPAEVCQYLGVPDDRALEARRNYWSNIWAMHPEVVREHATDAERQRGDIIWRALQAAAAASSDTESERASEARAYLTAFAKRAWRIVPSEAEIDGLMELYENARKDGQSTEAAFETALRAVLISPKFLYRVTESRQQSDPYPLSGRELATRLAFVLWSGLPDERLYQLADAGKLNNAEVLVAEIDRMLAHDKAGRFIEEFFGRWLGFAEFDQFSGPDQAKFEVFSNELRADMYAEAKRFTEYILREDRPATELLQANYTFINERLAKHYGIAGVDGDQLRRVVLSDSPRGGLLGMGAFLTKTSTPLRTSPVHRGLWIYEGLLDLPVPEPPPVPQLSDEGVDESGKTITEQLRQHRDDPACYSCHDRFDPLGVALENFDPVGRWREKVEGKAPVNAKGEFRSGQTIDGLAGLRQFLRSQEEQFLEALVTKLLGYSLGRSVLPTDRPTIESMLTAMHSNDLSVRAALKVALTSPQFLNRRDEEVVAETAANF